MSWLQTHREQVAEILSRAKEPYYREVPYRNRTDGGPSWQHRIIWEAPNWKGRVVACANRTGKSRLGGFETALIVTGEHPTYKSPQNGRAWIVGLDSSLIESIEKPYFEQFIPNRYIKNGKWNGKYNYWTFNSDGRNWEVWFKSADSGRKKFQGDKIDWAWIDEEITKEGVFDEIEMRLVDNQGIWLLTATPIEGTRWLKETMEREDVYDTTAGMIDNPYIPMIEIEAKKRTLSKDDYDVRVLGKYIVFGGRPVFDRELLDELEKNVKPYREGVLVTA